MSKTVYKNYRTDSISKKELLKLYKRLLEKGSIKKQGSAYNRMRQLEGYFLYGK
jgi:hypothetical protein